MLSVWMMARGRHFAAIAQSTSLSVAAHAAGTVHRTWSRATVSGNVNP